PSTLFPYTDALPILSPCRSSTAPSCATIVTALTAPQRPASCFFRHRGDRTGLPQSRATASATLRSHPETSAASPARPDAERLAGVAGDHFVMVGSICECFE